MSAAPGQIKNRLRRLAGALCYVLWTPPSDVKRMAKILFAWEMGSGLGHLTRFVPIAVRLQALGHDIMIVAPSEEEVSAVVKANSGPEFSCAFVEGPHWRGTVRGRRARLPNRTLGDVLWRHGFAEHDELLPRVQHWRDVLKDFRPDLVISDFAITLSLALRERAPHFIIGDGFNQPPTGRFLPPLTRKFGAANAYSRGNEGALLAAFNRIARLAKDPPIHYVADILSGSRNFLCTIPELDHYAAYRDGDYLLPAYMSNVKPGPTVAAREGVPIAAYLPGGHPQLRDVVRAIAETGVDCHAYVSDPPPDLFELGGDCVKFRKRPIDYAATLPAAKLLIHHGGLGSSITAFLAGTPQLMFPENLEHQLNALGMVEAEVAVTMLRRQPAPVADIIDAIEAIMADGAMQATALRAAASRADMDVARTFDEMIGAAERTLG